MGSRYVSKKAEEQSLLLKNFLTYDMVININHSKISGDYKVEPLR